MPATVPTPVNQRTRVGVLWLGAVLLLPILIVSQPYFSDESMVIEVSRAVGLLLIITGVIGRLWSILYVGRHKNRSLVVDGPYSITRNPLYFFSTLGAFGFGLVFGKLSLALLLGGMVFMVLYLTARREQAFLLAKFGPEYADYAARVPMFLPDVRLFATPPTVLVSVEAIRRTLLDAFVFLSAIPLAEISEALVHRFDLPLIVLP